MSNINLDDLERACGRLGEVVIEPGAWPRVMDDLSKAVGATGALLLQSDNRTPDVPYSQEIEELATDISATIGTPAICGRRAACPICSMATVLSPTRTF